MSDADFLELSGQDGIVISREEARQWSEAVRALRPEVNAFDIQEIAGYTGVSPVTVRRWFSPGTSARTIIPLNIAGKPWHELTDGQRTRLFAAKAIGASVGKRSSVPGLSGTYKESYGGLGTLFRQLKNILVGDYDPYLERQMTHLSAGFNPDTGLFEIRAVYSKGYTIDMFEDDIDPEGEWELGFIGLPADDDVDADFG